jgi:hypothetical protein
MEDYCGLPFVTVSNERMTYMNETIGELIERLIRIKRDYDIYYPDDNIINVACNILERLPREENVYEWIEQHRNNRK